MREYSYLVYPTKVFHVVFSLNHLGILATISSKLYWYDCHWIKQVVLNSILSVEEIAYSRKVQGEEVPSVMDEDLSRRTIINWFWLLLSISFIFIFILLIVLMLNIYLVLKCV